MDDQMQRSLVRIALAPQFAHAQGNDNAWQRARATPRLLSVMRRRVTILGPSGPDG
jgi:hypothetical protein